jgi:hypothetical protein
MFYMGKARPWRQITAKVSIEGTRPLLWHHFGPDAIPLESKARTGKAGNDPEEWRKTVLATKDGQLYLEPSYIFACLRAGAKQTRRGRGTMQATVGASLEVLEERVLVDRRLPAVELDNLKQAKDKPVYLDVQSVRNPVTGARNIRYRVAASPGWKAAFTLRWDNTLVSREEMEHILHDSGRFAGLGDGRSIGFGRFEVRSVEVEVPAGDGNAKKQTAKGNLGKNKKNSLAAR